MQKNRVILISAAILLVFVVAALLLVWSQNPKLPEENSSLLSQPGGLEVTAGETDYFNGVRGFFAQPKTPGAYPGIVMIHEWWGLNENIKNMAQELAKEGYAVLAVDLYRGQVAATREEAQALRNALKQDEAVQNLHAAVSFLKERNAEKIASLGWCFGGGKSLELALSGEKLDATVIYYGSLVTDKSKLQKIKWPVLGIFGDKDASIPTSTVREFGNALTSLGIQNSIHVYPGVGHAFANPSGQSYAPEETKDAWQKTLQFLQVSLKNS